MNKPVAGDEFAVDEMSELPLTGRNHLARPIARVANGEHIARIVGIGDRVLAAADSDPHQMSERNIGHYLRRHQVSAHQACDGLSVFLCDRSIQSRGAWPGCVPLPTEAHHRESSSQQPRVSIVSGKIVIAAFNEGHAACAPTVGNLEEHRAVRFFRVPGTNGNEIGGKLDLAILQIHGVGKINDLPIVRVGHGKRKIDASDDALAGPGIAEQLAIQDVGARSDLNSQDPRIEWKRQPGPAARGMNPHEEQVACETLPVAQGWVNTRPCCSEVDVGTRSCLAELMGVVPVDPLSRDKIDLCESPSLLRKFSSCLFFCWP